MPVFHDKKNIEKEIANRTLGRAACVDRGAGLDRDRQAGKRPAVCVCTVKQHGEGGGGGGGRAYEEVREGETEGLI